MFFFSCVSWKKSLMEYFLYHISLNSYFHKFYCYSDVKIWGKSQKFFNETKSSGHGPVFLQILNFRLADWMKFEWRKLDKVFFYGNKKPWFSLTVSFKLVKWVARESHELKIAASVFIHCHLTIYSLSFNYL